MKTELTPQEVAKNLKIMLDKANDQLPFGSVGVINCYDKERKTLNQAAADELKIANGEYALVVRCGECEYASFPEPSNWIPDGKIVCRHDVNENGKHQKSYPLYNANSYCSYGKRKEGKSNV